METIVAGRTAILRQEGRLVMGWIEELGLLRYGESVPEVLQGLERDARGAPRRRLSPVVAARRRQRWEEAMPLQPPRGAIAKAPSCP